MLAGDWASARAQFLHVALLDFRRRREGSQPKTGGGLMPVASVEATAARWLPQTAWARSVEDSVPLSSRFTHVAHSRRPPVG